MDKSTYTFQALSEKYEDFRGPAFTIKVDGKTLDSKELPIVQLEVNLSDSLIGGCKFSVESLYDYEKSKWINSLEESIKVGDTVTVSGGYGKQEELFCGYVYVYHLEYSKDRPPRLEVRAVDGLEFLCHCMEPVYHGNKTPKAVVEEIFRKVISAGYAKKMKVDGMEDLLTPLVKELTSDYDYLRLLGRMYGLTLINIRGELIFSDLISDSTSLISLTLGAGLLSFRRRTSLEHQVGKVEIRGKDVNQKPITGIADRVTVGDSGKKWAGEVAPAIKKTGVRLYNEYVRTEAECKRVAQSRLNRLALSFVQGSGRCVGLPEIIPGRYISIKGVDAMTAGSYYICGVTHRFSREGYYTDFEVKGARA